MQVTENQHLTRQLDIIPLKILDEKITIIGAGAIGGWTCLALAKMGFHDITVFDHDNVDVENMNGQFYRFADIGTPKAIALARLVEDFTKVKIEAVPVRYEGGRFPGVVIAAVDSMEVRKKVWNEHKFRAPSTRAIIDPRMGSESALLYVMSPMRPTDATAYEKSLYDDSEALHEKCTGKLTIYTANMLSGLVVKAVKDLLTREDHLRTAQWDIKENQFFGFARQVG